VGTGDVSVTRRGESLGKFFAGMEGLFRGGGSKSRHGRV
jgi:hypothetical protein